MQHYYVELTKIPISLVLAAIVVAATVLEREEPTVAEAELADAEPVYSEAV